MLYGGPRRLAASVDLASLTPSQGIRIDGAAAGDEIGGSLRWTRSSSAGRDDLVIDSANPGDHRTTVIRGRSTSSGTIDVAAMARRRAAGRRARGAADGGGGAHGGR